ncbi:MAG: extensin-like domain-containing protein [Xanthobacteraceae bacterium]
MAKCHDTCRQFSAAAFLIVVGALASGQDARAQGAPQFRFPQPTLAAQAQPVIVPVPLPRPRPVEAGPRAAVPEPPQTEASVPAEPSACFLALTAGLADAQQLPPIANENGCEAPDVVQLDAVILPDRRRVEVTPPAVLRCPMATAVANWVRGELLAAISAQGGALAKLDNFDSFECRGMNRVAGAKMSEHGRANALDIRALVLAGGKKLGLTDPEVARDLRESLRQSACTRFTTVLGPGSDGYHEDHVHIDLAERRNGYRICQWDVRDPVTPLPRERPAEAPVAQ